MMGATPEKAAAMAAEEGADALGANCGAGPESFADIARRFRQTVPELPVWIKPNAGLPVYADGAIVYKVDAASFATHVPALLEAGASFVGGCCGSTPEFIRAIAEKWTVCASS